jgi:hypothetical protein
LKDLGVKLQGRGKPLDRLVTLDDSELNLACALDGCAAHFFGRPLEECPWPKESPAHWQGWRRGWLAAAVSHTYTEEEERDRWLLVTTTTTEEE